MIRLAHSIDVWPLRTPLEISRGVLNDLPFTLVSLTDDAGHVGRGEAAGVMYEGETPDTIAAQIEAVRPAIEAGCDRQALLDLLPAGGARNALDCALWDLEAKRAGQRAWALAGLGELAPVTTAFTIGLGTPEAITARATAARHMPLLKIKLDARRHVDVVEIVRRACPDSRLIVDANQAWDFAQLVALAPALAALGVELIEQPLPVGQDGALADYASPIPLAADESCTDRASLPPLVDRYDFITLKLDKSGGLTEALALARQAEAAGLRLMVGCMAGTSLAMAPALLVAQRCDIVDLDGPLLHSADRPHRLTYEGGRILPPEPALWG